jgi:hypothetical protein
LRQSKSWVAGPSPRLSGTVFESYTQYFAVQIAQH